MTSKAERSEAVAKLAKLIKGIKFAMLTTACDDGTLRSRPMATQRRPFDGELWFFTDDESPKVSEIRKDQHVNVSYADPDSNTYVSVSGRATLVKDKARAKELWNPFYRAWFPDGLDDPRLGLLRVTVEQAEYWDAPSSAMAHLFGVAKAMVTGKRASDVADHKKVRLRRPAAPPTPRRRSAAASSAAR